MTDAERQARYRAARAAGAPVIRMRRALDHRSRARRWNDAVAGLVEAQAQYAAWLEACRTTSETALLAEALQAICDLDLTELRRSTRHAASAGTDPLAYAVDRLAPVGPQEPPARRCVSLLMGTPRRAGPPYGLPAQANTGGSILDADRGSIFNAD